MDPDVAAREALALAGRAGIDAGVLRLEARSGQLGWGLREPADHHRTGRTLAQTRAWAKLAVDLVRYN